MTLIAESDSLLRQMSRTLQQRKAELRALLQEAAGANIAGDNPPEVLDFKDVAAEETRAVVDEAAYAAHAESEHAKRFGFDDAIPRLEMREREIYITWEP